ncbi:MAG: chromate efflux transporter [Polyangia bacterium]
MSTRPSPPAPVAPAPEAAPPGPVSDEESRRRLREVVALFLRLGLTSIGGPAAHIAAMEREVVQRRAWLSREEFLDLLGATNLIPGPNSTEMAIHLGFLRAGWPGLLAAGACFIVPAALITCALAAVYLRYGALPSVQPLLTGMQAAVVAAVFLAVWSLGRSALRGIGPWALAAAATGAGLAGVPELLVVALGGLLGALAHALKRRAARGAVAGLVVLGGWSGPSLAATLAAKAAAPTLGGLFWFFLKVGSVIYGSGYVLVAFLEGGLVRERGWLTAGQLLNAVAAGQVTPGPVFTTATFVGYLLHGPAGAAVATAGIFLPSFLLVALLSRILGWLRRSPIMRGFLDGLSSSSLGVMTAVGLQLLWAARGSRAALGIAAAALGVGIVARGRISPTWLVLGGGLLGLLLC